MLPFTDLNAQYLIIKDEITKVMQQVLDEGLFILGPDVKRLEDEIANYCGVKYGIGVASGTDALVLALIASGIKERDEVITTPFTFVATGEAIVRVGAVPVFVDIDERTCNIDPCKIEEKITDKTKGIIPVHLYGQCCDMDKIMEISKNYDLKVIEDCAQSIGSEYKGKKAGSIGDAGCLSFFPAKTLGCYGDGGMVVTNNQEIAGKVDVLRRHGCKKKNCQEMHGFNSRLDTIQASILRVKLKYLDNWIECRIKNARLYSELFSSIEEIIPPYIAPYGVHSFNYFTIKIKAECPPPNERKIRDKLQKYLTEKGISCGVYYPVSLHLQEVYEYLGYKKGDFPVSEKIQEEIISLPMYPELKTEQIKLVVETIKNFLQEGL